MQSTADHLDLAPPPPGHWHGPMGQAVVVHVLLLAALTWGVSWQHDADTPAVEAELWSRLPVQAAARAVEPPPPPPAPPPAPAPRPAPVPAPAPPPPAPRPPDIATRKAQAAAEQKEREEAAAQKKAAADRKLAEQKAAEAQAAAAKKAAADKARQEQQAKAAEAREAAEAAKRREEQIARMMGQAGASGGPQSTGTAQQSSGPSATYGARVAASIRPNVVFTDVAPGNPRAEVEVRTAPDGTITARKLVKSSGNPAWDEAVLRAIDRTDKLPRDTDGRVPSVMVIGLRPLD